ncbi:dimethyladenosine transferase 2, mitochondrial [Danaus plexippus]|uniref:dimethyladenosine transferase 2, mitochondrial n=1 Tax=Danaus plexippus TaxID=13037 RepID=UPI002AAF6267|nr:dimethyladenosine transferase 2, mitochondrial [Danaus plexippus]
MFSSSKTLLFANRPFGISLRWRQKLNKQQKEEKPSKVAADVMKYLESHEEYKNIINVLPKTLLKKYKTPETMYLINRKTAVDMSQTIFKYLDKDAPVIEVNPGFGYITEEFLKHRKTPIYLYENFHYFKEIFNDIKIKYKEQVKYKNADFFGMWKLAFQDKMDQGSRIPELLGELATTDNGRLISIIGAMPSLSFVRHLINTIVFHNTTSQLGRPDLYIAMSGSNYEFLTDSSIMLSKHKSLPALFQLLFDFKVLMRVPKNHFLPWTYSTNTAKGSVLDEYCLNIVRITQKETLPCAPNNLPLLWYFFKRHTFSKSTRVIPMLEQWIPGCGVWLITGQDPPETDMLRAPTSDDAALPHMTIFTEFGDLTLKQKLTVFKRFISWPEFEHCPFRTTMENNLPKFATHIADEKDVQLDEIENSDSDIET